TSRQNRPQHGLLFACQHCQCSLHADLVGARNSCLRMLVIRQDWMATGQLSRDPEGSDREAKTARLSRYAELRWSLATSLLRKPEVLDTPAYQPSKHPHKPRPRQAAYRATDAKH